MSGIECVLYEPNGSTEVAVIGERMEPQFMEEMNGCGGGSLMISATWARVNGVDYDHVVKARYEGAVRAAFVIEVIERNVVSDDGRVWTRVSGRGLMSWLDDAVVYPQVGGSDYSPTERPFDFAAVGKGRWEARTVWVAPQVLGWQACADARKAQPKGWPDKSAAWMWRTNPNAAVANGTLNYFRKSFYLPTARKVRLFAAADNNCTVYIDGTQVLATSDSSSAGATYTRLLSKTVTLDAGTHWIAARVTNGKQGSGTNKAGFLFAATNVGNQNKPTTTIVRSSTAWEVTDDSCKWYPAEIMETLKDEAVARGVNRIGNIITGWGETTDSNSRAWETAVVQSFRCGTPYLQVLDTLVDHGVDFWLSPSTLYFRAYETRGSDKSATVMLAPGKNLTDYNLSGSMLGRTAALIRTADGWASQVDVTGDARWGRREGYLEYGGTRSESTAKASAARWLRQQRYARKVVTAAACVPVVGAVPFVDFGVGDQVRAPDWDATPLKVRVLSITLSEDGTGNVVYSSELEVVGNG